MRFAILGVDIEEGDYMDVLIDIEEIKAKVARKEVRYANRKAKLENGIDISSDYSNVKEEVNEFDEKLTSPTAIDCYKRMNMSSICLKPDPQKDTVEFSQEQ